MQEIQYTQGGDYLIPQLHLEQQSEEPLSRYARIRQTYLREHRETLYNHLLMSGKLYQHLKETDQSAQERLQTLMAQGMKQEGLTEAMKAQDPTRWMGLMNSLKAQAEEVILREIIYS